MLMAVFHEKGGQPLILKHPIHRSSGIQYEYRASRRCYYTFKEMEKIKAMYLVIRWTAL